MKDMDIDIGDLVGSFYSENIRSVLRIKSSDDTILDPAMDTLILPDASPLYRLVARHEYDLNKLYVLTKPFKDWCVKQGHHYTAIVDLIKTDMNGKHNKVRLGRGTKISLPPQHVLEMSWSYDAYVSHQQDRIDLVSVSDSGVSDD